MHGPTIGLVGCGRWGKFILRDLKALGCVVRVVAVSAESRQNALDGNADEVVDSTRKLCQTDSLDGLIVATPSATHFSVIQEVLDLQPELPLFCEKPLAISAADAHTLLAERSANVFVMDKWRYHPGVLKLAELAREKVFGAVIGIRTERLGWGIPHNDTNAVWHLMPHDLSIVQEILGKLPEIRSSHVESACGQPVGAFVELGNAPWATCFVSARYPHRRRSIQLIFDTAVAELSDGYATEIVISRGPLNAGDLSPAIERLPVASDLPLERELSAFVGHVSARGPAPKSSLQDAVRVVEAIEQILRGSAIDG